MRNFLLTTMLLTVTHCALAQAPADDALQRGQRKAGAAFSELQKAEYEAKRAEQEFKQ